MQIFALKSLSRSGNKLPDGSYRTFERELGLFDSVGKAEEFMRVIIAKESRFSAFHCFFIFEKTLNRELSEKFECVCEFESVRTYFPDGTLCCDSPYDGACDKPFRGRPAATVTLKPGELAWYWQWDRISPCLIAIPPMTDERYRQYVQELGHELGLDGSDDSYMVWTVGDGHQHPECWRGLPYYGTISRRNLQRLHACQRREEAMAAEFRNE